MYGAARSLHRSTYLHLSSSFSRVIYGGLGSRRSDRQAQVLREICSEVVDRRILETRGVPSQQVSKRSRRANAGGKETPRCTEYIRTRGYAKSSCSTSTRLLEPERGGCSPRPSKQRSSSTSKLPEVSAMREGTPWW